MKDCFDFDSNFYIFSANNSADYQSSTTNINLQRQNDRNFMAWQVMTFVPYKKFDIDFFYFVNVAFFFRRFPGQHRWVDRSIHRNWCVGRCRSYLLLHSSIVLHTSNVQAEKTEKKAQLHPMNISSKNLFNLVLIKPKNIYIKKLMIVVLHWNEVQCSMHI